jgi:adenine phosphoribosyltransferase
MSWNTERHTEIHTDAIRKGDRVLIHDDVLATGGTAQAVCELVEKLGGEIVQLNFLMESLFSTEEN